MTRRPRSHQIEDESRAALRTAFPDSWVIDHVQADYGLDERVEIFDFGGASTGLVFYVQLKATEQPDLPRALRLRVDKEHLAYWNSFSDPVMITLWHVPSKRLYWKWIHYHHPYVKRALRNPRSANLAPRSETVNLMDSDAWNPADERDIVLELRFLKKLSQGGVRFPLDIGVTRSSIDTPSDAMFSSFLSEIRRVVGPQYVRWHEGSEHPGRIHLFLGSRHLQVRVGRPMLSMTDLLERQTWQELLPFEVGTMLGIGLSNTGSVATGIQLVGRYAYRSQFVGSVKSPGYHLLQMSIIKASRYDLALDLVSHWLRESDPPNVPSAMAMLSVVSCSDSLMQPDSERLEELVGSLDRHLQEIVRTAPMFAARQAEKLGRYSEAADIYNSLKRRVSDQSSAPEELLDSSARIDLKMEQYESAIETLSALLDLRGDDQTRLRLSRAYLKAGQYSHAAEILRDIRSPRLAGQTRLAGVVLLFLTRGLKLEQQTRRSDEVDRLARAVDPEGDPNRIRSAFNSALLLDAVAPNTWRFQTLLVFSAHREVSLGALAVAVMAYVCEDDSEWFVFALVEALSDGAVQLAAMVSEAAIELFSPDIVSVARRLIGPGDICDRVVNLLQAVMTIKEGGLAVATASGQDSEARDSVAIFGIDTFDGVRI